MLSIPRFRKHLLSMLSTSQHIHLSRPGRLFCTMSHHLVDADGDTIMTDDESPLHVPLHISPHLPAQSTYPSRPEAHQFELPEPPRPHSGHQPSFYPGSFGLGSGTRFQPGTFGMGASQPLAEPPEPRQPHFTTVTVPSWELGQSTGHLAPLPGHPPAGFNSIPFGVGSVSTQNHSDRSRQGPTDLAPSQGRGGCRACNRSFCSLCRTFHDRALNRDYLEAEDNSEDERDGSIYTDYESEGHNEYGDDDSVQSYYDDDDEEEEEDDGWIFQNYNGMNQGIREEEWTEVRRAVDDPGEFQCLHCNTTRYCNYSSATRYCDVCMESSSRLERCRDCFLDLCPACLRGGRDGSLRFPEPSRRRNGFFALDMLDY